MDQDEMSLQLSRLQALVEEKDRLLQKAQDDINLLGSTLSDKLVEQAQRASILEDRLERSLRQRQRGTTEVPGHNGTFVFRVLPRSVLCVLFPRTPFLVVLSSIPSLPHARHRRPACSSASRNEDCCSEL